MPTGGDNEQPAQAMVQKDSYHDANEPRPIVIPDFKMNANIEYYAGQVTNNVVHAPHRHNAEIVFEDGKKWDDHEAHTWATGEQTENPRVNAHDSVRAALRDEYIEYTRTASGLMHNSNGGRTLQTDSHADGVEREQNSRSEYLERPRSGLQQGSDYVQQKAGFASNIEDQLPMRRMPQVEQDVDARLVEPLKYNPLVPTWFLVIEFFKTNIT